MIDDKSTEQARYDRRAVLLQQEITSGKCLAGAESVAPFLRSPYRFYEGFIKDRVRDGQRVLEIGSGTGEFTGAAFSAGATVTATDISEKSLEALAIRFRGMSDRLTTRRADMEALPFEDGAFDAVISSGSLSYGDNFTVMREIYRVTKTGGCFICVDSLNHNPIYRFNRFIQCLRRERLVSTTQRMPTIELIAAYGRRFGTLEVCYFGAATWAMPVVSKIFSAERASKLSDQIDRLIGVKRAAFKFVMIVTKTGV